MLAGHNTLSLRSFPRSRGLRLLLGSWSCSDVGVPGRLVGIVELGNHPDHPSSLCGGDDWALDAAGGLEDLQYCDANPTKVCQRQHRYLQDLINGVISDADAYLNLCRDLKAVSKLVRLGLHVKKAERQNLTVPKVFQR